MIQCKTITNNMPPSGGFFFMCDVENTTPIYAASQLLFLKFFINLIFIIMLKIKFNSATQIGKAIYVQNVMLNDVLLMSETYLPTSQVTIIEEKSADATRYSDEREQDLRGDNHMMYGSSLQFEIEEEFKRNSYYQEED